MKNWHYLSHSPEQTRKLGKLIGKCCGTATVVLLEGDLGSGKTCFVQGLASGLDVPPEVPVNSPTYTLMNIYAGRLEIAHFDLYRLGSADELIELDFDAYLFGPGVTIVEWASLVDRQGLKGIAVQLDYGEKDDERSLQFVALDPEGERLLEQVENDWKER